MDSGSNKRSKDLTQIWVFIFYLRPRLRSLPPYYPSLQKVIIEAGAIKSDKFGEFLASWPPPSPIGSGLPQSCPLSHFLPWLAELWGGKGSGWDHVTLSRSIMLRSHQINCSRLSDRTAQNWVRHPLLPTVWSQSDRTVRSKFILKFFGVNEALEKEVAEEVDKSRWLASSYSAPFRRYRKSLTSCLPWGGAWQNMRKGHDVCNSAVLFSYYSWISPFCYMGRELRIQPINLYKS